MPVSQEEVERLIEENGLTACFDCGKCTASCPMSEVFADLKFRNTPRGIIEKALLSADLVTGDAIWYCLQCDVCTEGCPSGIKIRDFIGGLRALALQAGLDEYGVCCRRCNQYFLPVFTQRMLHEKIKSREATPAFLMLCQPCRRRDVSERIKKGLPQYGRATVRNVMAD